LKKGKGRETFDFQNRKTIFLFLGCLLYRPDGQRSVIPLVDHAIGVLISPDKIIGESGNGPPISRPHLNQALFVKKKSPGINESPKATANALDFAR
jgi:hypothetical protein